MMDLDVKVKCAVRLLQSVAKGTDVVELAYSGGKDSDVVLQLAREADIPYRAIYKNTTIDPPGTIDHVLRNGVEIVRPRRTFFQLMEKKGFPSRFFRFCCAELKEYKILDKVVLGIRREESTKRAKNYKEPTACRDYGGKKGKVEQILPILDWTEQDVADFVADRGIKCHPLYYDRGGAIPSRAQIGMSVLSSR